MGWKPVNSPTYPLPEPSPVTAALVARTLSNWMGNVMFTSVSSSFETAASFFRFTQ